MSITSNTLAVIPSGSNTEIELINSYSDLAISGDNTLTATAFSNNDVQAENDFTVDPPTNAVDGSQVRLRVFNAGGASINVSFDASIHVGQNAVPVTILSAFACFFLLEFNAVGNFWALLNVANGY